VERRIGWEYGWGEQVCISPGDQAVSSVDPNQVILTGENPFIKISEADGAPLSTDASYWRIVFSPAGPGHALYIKSELTDGEWCVYSDNIALARWLQSSIQGMLNNETADTTIPVVDAVFTQSGDLRDFWTETITAEDHEIGMTWYDIGEPLLIHTDPETDPDRPAGVCTILIPCAGARLTLDGNQAKGRPWPREREGRPFSTTCLAFSESWTELR